MNVCDLIKHGASPDLVSALAETGLKKLYPPQEQAVKAGLFDPANSFVVSAPTAAGKTLIAEIAALTAFLERGGKTIYTVPLRALAREKFEDLRKKYADTGMKIVQSTGDYDHADPWLRDADLIISTNEKIDSLLRHQAPWLKNVRLVVIDEIHLIGDEARGPTLEVVVTRLKWFNPRLRFIALSATIPNAYDISQWLKAKLIQSDWRPVPLREGVYFGDAVIFNDGEVSWVEQASRDNAVDLALETVRSGGQAIIFVSTRKATETTSRKAAPYMARLLTKQDAEFLKVLSETAGTASNEPTKLANKLSEQVASGVAFHHAGILSSQRRIIEDAFKQNKIKLIVATTTLAMGLNLPSRRVIIKDWHRYESGIGMRAIPVMEIKQMSGRAGRPGYDEFGEAVLVARSKRDERYLFDRYVKGKPEQVESRLASESVLRTHILSSIAGGFTRTTEDLNDFLSHTFFARQSDPAHLGSITEAVLAFLQSERMIEPGAGLKATRFGSRISDLYIDPLSGVVLRNALSMKKKKESSLPLMHMITRTPDMMVLPLKTNDIDEMLRIFHAHVNMLLIPKTEEEPTEDMLAQIKTSWVIMQWIEETSEDAITEYFDIGPGDLHTIVELSDWLLYSASEIAKVFGLADEVKTIFPLRTRIKYGVKQELLPLVALQGIGRVRARNLFKAGYRTQKDIKAASVHELSKIDTIGNAIAESIKQQVQS